jgi:hypothetical protein
MTDCSESALLCSDLISLSYLVVLSSDASDIQAFLPFLMSNLCEKTTYKSLCDSIVELSFVVVDGHNVQVIPFHDTQKLGANVIRLR